MNHDAIIIQRLDGTTYDLNAIGIRVISFDPPGANWQNTFTQMSQYHAVLTDRQMQQTTIPLVVQVRGHDVYDYELLRMKVLRVFAGYEPFYIISSRTPFMRWKVVPEQHDFLRLSNSWLSQPATINLDCPDGVSETTETTLSSQFPFTDYFGSEVSTENPPTYTFANQTSFNVINGGTIPLRNGEHPVLIHFSGDVGSALSIANARTQQTLTINHEMSSTDKLEIYGMKPLLNGQSIYSSGNHAFLDFMPGDNQITVSGASNFTISFETRFYM